MNNDRKFYLALLVCCLALLAIGYTLQFGFGQEPCPLCILQRIVFMAVTLAALAGLIHGPGRTGKRVYSGLILLLALVGAGIAAWQVRLQYLPPDRVPECGPGLDYMLEVFPLVDVLRMAFTGSGECAEVDWTFLTLSIAEWSLAWFLLFAIAAGVHVVQSRRM